MRTVMLHNFNTIDGAIKIKPRCYCTLYNFLLIKQLNRYNMMCIT